MIYKPNCNVIEQLPRIKGKDKTQHSNTAS